MKILAVVILSLLGICLIGGTSYGMWISYELWWAGLALIAGACIIAAAIVWSIYQLMGK